MNILVENFQGNKMKNLCMKLYLRTHEEIVFHGKSFG